TGGGRTGRGTRAAGSAPSTGAAGPGRGSWRGLWVAAVTLREAAVPVARDRAEVAHGPATDPRGALARRQRQAADADRGGTRLLGRRVRRALQDPHVLSRRGGAGPVAGGQAARPRPAVLHRHPRALQRHHGAVELLPREGPRSPRLGAGRLATDLPREARGDADALVLDGGADDGPDPRR